MNACLLPVRITPHAETWSMPTSASAPHSSQVRFMHWFTNVSKNEAWLMCCGLFQASTVRYIRTPVWSSGARMEDAVRVEGEMCPVCVHQDIWVNISGCLHLYDIFVSLAGFGITYYHITTTSNIGILNLLESTDL